MTQSLSIWRVLNNSLSFEQLNTMWLDQKNYAEKTRGMYARISRFPLNFLVPTHLRNLAFNHMASLYPPEFRKKFFDLELVEKARGVLKLLSEELKDSRYFSGTSTPNELDALIFGYLAVIAKLPLPNLNNLQQFMFERRNLLAYVNRVLTEYFPEQAELDKKLSIEQAKDSKIDDLESASWKSIIFVGLFAVASNLLFATYMISRNEDDESSDEDD